MLKLFDDKITIEQEIIQTQLSTQVWNNIIYTVWSVLMHYFVKKIFSFLIFF